jgi:asparagine synthase (glutamine-hydrolysing)
LSVQEAISALHNTALQRVDRSATAHGSYAAVPFLDPDVVRYALAIPARWKIRGPQSIEKWPLRHGLADTLPDEVIWRGKSKFWEGAGSGEMLADILEGEITDADFLANRELGNGEQLKSKEELHYYCIFNQIFGSSVPLEEIGRTQHI